MFRFLSPTLIYICIRDFFGASYLEQKNEAHIKAGLDWLKLAQDKSGDGGVAAWYSLVNGWAPSYIETTGYIISTFLDTAKYFNDPDLKKRAIKMGDFLLNMQNSDGSYLRNVPTVTDNPDPVIFNTGQDIIGLVDLYQETKIVKYLNSAVKAADFLCSVQEKDGSWVKFEYGDSPRSYETRTAWALIKVATITNNKKYRNCGIKNLEWAAANQLNNGWFECSDLPFPNPSEPLTHTISYVIEGFLWSGLLIGEKKYVEIAKKGANQVLEYFNKSNYLPGTFDRDWKSKDSYTCLTGDAQIALVWLELYKITKETKYLVAAKKLNTYLKKTQNISSKNNDIRGGIKGSFPIYGDLKKRNGYCRMAFLNWAVKFFIDSLLAEEIIEKEITK